MNPTHQEKPSLILMLAPMAIVLLGYYYLFFASLNSDLSKAGKRQTSLQEQTENIGQDQSEMDSRLLVAKNELARAKRKTAAAEKELAITTAEKAELRSLVLGQIGPTLEPAEKQIRSVAKVNQSNSATSNEKPNSSMLISTASGRKTSDLMDEDGPSGRMNRLCAILDQHGLQRLATSDSPTGGKNSLVETERKKLETLLDASLPPVSRYEIQLIGSFPKLIAALHVLQERLPTVSILSISLDPVDVRTRRHVWKLEVGIRG